MTILIAPRARVNNRCVRVRVRSCIRVNRFAVKLFGTQPSITCLFAAGENNIYLASVKTTIYFRLTVAPNENAKTNGKQTQCEKRDNDPLFVMQIFMH